MTRLEVITGPMFSGKSEELIRRLKRARIAEKRILSLKPIEDTRSHDVVARAKAACGTFQPVAIFPAVPVGDALSFRLLLVQEDPQVVALDEAQFFGPWVVDELHMLLTADRETHIIVAGLDMDAWGRPFGPMPYLMAMADTVQKLEAVCFACKRQGAMLSYKKGSGRGDQVEVGDNELYEARCRECWRPPK